jgi:extradiol dioxygenase family protein
MSLTPFHIAVHVRDIEESKMFYGEILGLRQGRSDISWVDFDMFGHQFVVDNHSVPVPHAGVVLEMDGWITFSNMLKDKEINFVIEPYIRFRGKPGEQATMFFLDPSGNALEFKAFKDIKGELFKTK